MHTERVWTVNIVFTEDEDRTRADAVLTGAAEELRGWGRAKRSPLDPDVPVIGEEIDAARALHDLGHHLIERAAHTIESWERATVHIAD